MRRLIIPVSVLAVLAGCLKFESDGIYACDPETMKDCLVCDASGWCQDFAPRRLGASALLSMSGSGPDSVWAVGESGKAFFWNGTRWADRSLASKETLNSVWAASPDEVWVSGDNATWARWDGTRWTEGRITNDTWSYNSTTYPRTIYGLTAIGGTKANYHFLFTADSAGAILLWNGSDWDLYYDTLDSAAWWGIATASDGTTYFVGENNDTGEPRFAWDAYIGNAPAPVDVTSATTHGLRAAVANGTGDAWIAGMDGMFHWSGTALEPQSAPSGAGLWATCSPGPDELFAVGSQGRVLHYATGTWTEVAQPFTSVTLFGAYCTQSEIFAAASDGIVLRRKLPLQ